MITPLITRGRDDSLAPAMALGKKYLFQNGNLGKMSSKFNKIK